jgi:capsular polysaccharide transport system permease protein
MPETKTESGHSNFAATSAGGSVVEFGPKGSRAVASARNQGAEAVATVYDEAHTASRWRVVLSFVIVVILPVIAASILTLFVASNRYVSEFRVSVNSLDQAKFGGIGEMLGFSGATPTGNSASAVVQYLQSRQAIADISAAVPFRSLYADPGIDLFSRMRPDSKIEEVERYWNKFVSAYYETSTNTIIVRVTAFDPRTALELATALLNQSEIFVNRLSKKARDDSVRFAEKEVADAEDRLQRERARLATLQNREQILDPMKSAETTLALVAKLKDQIASRRALLQTQRIQLGENAPSIQATNNIVTGLEQELARVEAQVTAVAKTAETGPDGKPLTAVMIDFQRVQGEKEFAEKAYASALASLESARIDARNKQVYLATIVPPGLPEEASFPKPFRDMAIVAGIALFVWLTGILGFYAIREHM